MEPTRHVRTKAAVAAIALAGSAAAAERPNIVFILADDLGYGELGCYGQTKIRTPNVDRLAGEGLRFTRHYSGSPVCAPSRCVLMTGRHPGHAFIRDNRKSDQPEGQLDIPADTVTVAWVLRRHGYATGLFGKWGLGTLAGTGRPEAQGFDRWFGYLCQAHAHSLYPAFLRDDGREFALQNQPPIPGHAKFPEGADPADPAAYAAFKGSDYAPDRIRQAAVEFIRRNADRPFFLYYANVLPHLALMVPDADLAPYLGRWEDAPYLGDKGYTPHRTPRAAYAAFISRFDADVGAVLAALQETGLANRTLVVVTSDNGPTHDVGGVDTVFFDSTGGLRGRKGSMYEGGIRVPCIVRWPGRVAAGRVTDALSGFEDWMPTLLDIAGAEAPVGLDGINLRPLLEGGTLPSRPFLYREFAGYGGWQAAWQGPWKALRANLRSRKGAAGAVKTQLYNLNDDPAETSDVADCHPDVVARLEAILRREHIPSPQFPLSALDGPPAQ